MSKRLRRSVTGVGPLAFFISTVPGWSLWLNKTFPTVDPVTWQNLEGSSKMTHRFKVLRTSSVLSGHTSSWTTIESYPSPPSLLFLPIPGSWTLPSVVVLCETLPEINWRLTCRRVHSGVKCSSVSVLFQLMNGVSISSTLSFIFRQVQPPNLLRSSFLRVG